MNKEELAALIDSFAGDVPARLTEDEENAILAMRMGLLVEKERPAVIELLRDWIAVRIPESNRQSDAGVHEGAMWLALEGAERYSLCELRPDIEALIADIRAGKTHLPYYADMISKYLNQLS
jgi:hypothetical protein